MVQNSQELLTIICQKKKNKILGGLPILPIKIHPHAAPSSTPIPHATLTFSDPNKIRYGILIQHPCSKSVTYVIPNPGSIRLNELLAPLKVLVECQTEPINFFSDNMLYRQFM